MTPSGFLPAFADRLLAACFAALFLVLLSAPAAAQDSQWGVTVSFVPQWKAIPELYEYIWDADETFKPDGKEFRVGVVRGSDGGGDWSVTFVRNWFRTDQVFETGFGAIGFTDQFGNFEEVVTDRFTSTIVGDVVLTGVKYEKFTPFVTIRDRVQVGLTYGGGIGSLSGTVRNEEFHVDVEYPPPTFMPILSNPRETVTDGDINDLYSPSVVAIGSVEAAASFILAPGLKLRVTGGFNYPNTQIFSFTLNYLIGSP